MGMHVWENAETKFEERICAKCKGKVNEALPEECPERPLTEEEQQKIKAKNLDFVCGRWRTYVDINAY